MAFVDSDDWVDQNYIEVLMQGICQYGANVSACSFTKAYTIGGIREKTEDLVLFKRISSEELLKNWILRKTVWGKIYKKSLLCGHRFVPEVKMVEDTLFNLDVLSHADGLKLYYTDIPLYYWYMREDSITHTVDLTRCLDFTRWYAEHSDSAEHTGYEWVMGLSAVKFALSVRYFSIFEENGNEIREEANAFLKKIIPDMIRSKYTPRKMKYMHYMMYLLPDLYRAWRLFNDPSMLDAEKKRLLRLFRHS